MECNLRVVERRETRRRGRSEGIEGDGVREGRRWIEEKRQIHTESETDRQIDRPIDR